MQILTQPALPAEGPPIFHIVRDLRGDAVDEIDDPHPPAGLYPDVILQLAGHLSDDYSPSPYQFHDLWEFVLTHWFPERDGYNIVPQWAIPYLGPRDANAANVTFAVLDAAAAPVLLLQVSAPRDFHNVHTREAAEALSAAHFEHVAPYCPLERMCVVSAMGKKWSALLRSPNLTAYEARSLGEERVDWMADVVSEVSYELMERLVADLKAGVPTTSLY